MSVIPVLLLTLWIAGSTATLLHLHVGKLLLGQWQPPSRARKFQTPVKVFWNREYIESLEKGEDHHFYVFIFYYYYLNDLHICVDIYNLCISRISSMYLSHQRVALKSLKSSLKNETFHRIQHIICCRSILLQNNFSNDVSSFF